MTESADAFHDHRLLALTGRYATPLAFLLITLGIVLSQPVDRVRNVSIGLFLFGMAFNVAFVQYVKRQGKAATARMAKLRMGVNVALNACMVYFLGGYWAPMWLLLALTPIVAAVYGSRARTLWTSAGTSLLLLLIHACRGENSPLAWGEQLAYTTFIILLSLMINELRDMAAQRKV